MSMRAFAQKAVRALLWVTAVCPGIPLTLRFGVYALWVAANALDGAGLALCLEAAAELLPLGACAAITVTTLLRLTGRRLPKWWWSGLGAAWAVSCAAGWRFPGELTTLPLLTSAVLLALNGLWTLLERRGDAPCG